MSSQYSLPAKKEWSTPIKEGDSIPSVTFKTRVRVESEEDDENPFVWKDMTTEDYFKGKRVVLFALPGAFTPTCSNTHLPGYHAAYKEIKSLGIDEVYCLSVNDAFVMRQWGLHLGLPEDKSTNHCDTITTSSTTTTSSSSSKNATNLGFLTVKLIPDGAALFTRGMGMSCVWENERGFGERSWRYSAVIHDMVVEKLFIEGGPVVTVGGNVAAAADDDADADGTITTIPQDFGPDPFEVSDATTMIKYLKESK